jgi:preprotein translocase subunit YajC
LILLSLILGVGEPATNQTPQKPVWTGLLENPFWLMVLMLLVFYVFMIKNKKGQDRKRQDMLTQLKRGDRIQTIGGILGTVVEAREDEVLVKVDESSNTKIRFTRNAIHRVVDTDKTAVK